MNREGMDGIVDKSLTLGVGFRAPEPVVSA